MAEARATDIITYVGIPLAVLGVLPTLSTTLKSVVTARTITRSLVANGVTDALTRSSLLSGIIEIEIPRKSITPLDRNDEAYWKLNEHDSSLRGGTWTRFRWKEMVIGVKSYRVQYHDELVQPQAEIDFEALIAFLLDRGAVPNASGFADLRSSGLWTPAGTKLLLSPCTSDAVLMVARSDDSDGILSLSLYWEKEWDRRWDERLPPYWVRVRSGRTSRKRRRIFDSKEQQSEEGTNGDMKEVKVEDKADAASTESASDNGTLCSPIRLRVSASGVEQAYHEDSPKLLLDLHHFHQPSSSHASMSPVCLWFNAALTALGAPLGGLWSFVTPSHIISFSHRDSIPCGVLVLLGLLSDSDPGVPTWRSLPADSEKEEQFERHQRFLKQARDIQAEMKMSPEQASAARMQRMQEEASQWQRERLQKQVKEDRRVEGELRDALASPKLGVSVVGAACRKWLVDCGEVDGEVGDSVKGVVEMALYEMIQNVELAGRLAEMLEQWRNWTESGGMTKTNLEAVKAELKTFCFAACMLALVCDTSNHPAGSVVSDLQECLRMWRKVRLG